MHRLPVWRSMQEQEQEGESHQCAESSQRLVGFRV